jgi:hypothetical protein
MTTRTKTYVPVSIQEDLQNKAKKKLILAAVIFALSVVLVIVD